MTRLSLRRPVASFCASRAAALALSVGATAALGLSTSAFAQPVGDPARPGRPTQAQWQKIFPEHRQLLLQDHRARAAILQKGERCIAAAGNGDALRGCMREERSAMQQQRRQHMDAMRALFERNGMPAPQWKPRHTGPGGGPGWRGGDV